MYACLDDSTACLCAVKLVHTSVGINTISNDVKACVLAMLQGIHINDSQVLTLRAMWPCTPWCVVRAWRGYLVLISMTVCSPRKDSLPACSPALIPDGTVR